MGYLSNYIFYNSGNQCPDSFWQWSAMSLLAHVVGRKVWYNHGRFPIFPGLYVGLIGSAGSGKSTAKGEVKNLMVENFPQLLYSASIQSREDIVMQMADVGCVRGWQNSVTGKVEEFRPFYIIANEFESFLSVNPAHMIPFLVDIFDEKYFSTGFKGDRKEGIAQSFENPYVSILACGVPDWLMRELKLSMFTGGLGRRLILVVDEPTKPVSKPKRPEGWEVAHAAVVEHLKEAYFLSGEVKPTPDADRWFDNWYTKHWYNKPEDPILAQFHSTKHVMMMKIATLFVLDERPFNLTLKAEHFEAALDAFDRLVPRIQQLTSGIGRNALAGYATQMLEVIRVSQFGGIVGAIEEKRLYARTWRDAPDNKGERGYIEALQFLSETKQIMAAGAVSAKGRPEFVFLPEAWTAYVAKSEVIIKP